VAWGVLEFSVPCRSSIEETGVPGFAGPDARRLSAGGNCEDVHKIRRAGRTVQRSPEQGLHWVSFGGIAHAPSSGADAAEIKLIQLLEPWSK